MEYRTCSRNAVSKSWLGYFALAPLLSFTPFFKASSVLVLCVKELKNVNQVLHVVSPVASLVLSPHSSGDRPPD